ncbi:MAG: 3-oxoacyl-ACP synthase [Flavobacteriales bacterium]|jgi:hypothetical protein|nr:3-oxoacyl-ACP synthase [Flavobacteriales bacterium]
MNNLFSLKQAVHDACVSTLQERIEQAVAGMEQARESSTADTKSSAGDKHETARAMAQLELEKQAVALGNLREMEHVLQRIDPSQRSTAIVPGSLVSTDQGTYYISAAAGKLDVEGTTVMAISMQAPIVEFLKGIAPSGSGKFNGRKVKLLSVA